MGADIHSFAEVKRNGKWQKTGEVFPCNDFEKKHYKKDYKKSPFDWRDYGMFGFLANVRNSYSCNCITGQTRGLPEDSEYLNQYLAEGSCIGDDTCVKLKHSIEYEYHSHNFITLAKLLDWDYNQKLGVMSYRDFLGDRFFADIEILKNLGKPEDVRCVFWFDT